MFVPDFVLLFLRSDLESARDTAIIVFSLLLLLSRYRISCCHLFRL
jgi:hypothetical protein